MKKIYIQTVYIPRENILFVEEWLKHHKNLGIDEFWMYDNTGSLYKDFIGNLELDGKNRQGVEVRKLTKNLSDNDISNLEEKIFKNFNVKKINWSPRDANGNITYGQVEAIYDFKNRVKEGFCCFIDIDEFIFLKNHYNISQYIENIYNEYYQGILIKQKKYASRWENPNHVLSISKTFDIETINWAPKIIANLEKINLKPGSNIHNFIDNVILDEKNCYFKHFNHELNGHNWLLANYKNIDANWIPKSFESVWD